MIWGHRVGYFTDSGSCLIIFLSRVGFITFYARQLLLTTVVDDFRGSLLTQARAPKPPNLMSSPNTKISRPAEGGAVGEEGRDVK